MTPNPPSRRAALAGLLAVTGLVGCQSPNVPAGRPAAETTITPEGTAYLALNAGIARQTRDLFIADVEELLGRGAREIYILLRSPGGEALAALDIVDYMNRTRSARGVRFVTHAVGGVASAACFIYLAGSPRYATPTAGFLFHAAVLATTRPMNSTELAEEAVTMRGLETRLLAMLRTQTRLSDSEAQTYLRRTVLLSADDARRDGVVEGIRPVPATPGVKLLVIQSRPQTPGRTPTPAPPPN